MLGKKVKDKVTGFEGIAIGICNYLYGCQQVGVAPAAKDGKIENAQWFDIGRIKITGKGVAVEEVTAAEPGGPNDHPNAH